MADVLETGLEAFAAVREQNIYVLTITILTLVYGTYSRLYDLCLISVAQERFILRNSVI